MTRCTRAITTTDTSQRYSPSLHVAETEIPISTFRIADSTELAAWPIDEPLKYEGRDDAVDLIEVGVRTIWSHGTRPERVRVERQKRSDDPDEREQRSTDPQAPENRGSYSSRPRPRQSNSRHVDDQWGSLSPAISY